MVKKKKVSKWFLQRRVWASALSAIAAVCAVLGYTEAVTISSVIAGSLGLNSYIKPKK